MRVLVQAGIKALSFPFAEYSQFCNAAAWSCSAFVRVNSASNCRKHLEKEGMLRIGDEKYLQAEIEGSASVRFKGASRREFKLTPFHAKGASS